MGGVDALVAIRHSEHYSYFAGVPAWLVLLHVAGATAMWWATTTVALSGSALVDSKDARALARSG